ncbi:MAG: hypothetical protein JRI25_11375 [Deltaproteobacteria bacterium]|nr:hypothetical protein [Deltaproteobacteria bacterium]
MYLLIGVLLAIGLAALLFGAVVAWPAAPAGPAVVIGLVALLGSWFLLMVRLGRTAAALSKTSSRLEAFMADLRQVRAALGDAEQTLQAREPGSAVAPVLAEVLGRLERPSDDVPLDQLIEAYEGLARTSYPEPIRLEELVDRAERLATIVLDGRTLEVERTIEPHGPVSMDRMRVSGVLAHVLAAAAETAIPGSPIGLDLVEWKAGLMRVRVHASGPPQTELGPRRGALLLAAAGARSLGGSLEWETENGKTAYVLLIPLEEEDAPTDPNPLLDPMPPS